VLTSQPAVEFPRATNDGSHDTAGTLARVFGRSKSTSAEEVPTRPEETARVDGKGRPTPKRREQERGRRRAVTAPKTRKEAYRSMRERQREERVRSMRALKAGDESALPPRDRGPVRRYVRDFVDARRTVAEFFLPLALVILVLSFSGVEGLRALGSYLWLVLVVLIVLDSLMLAFRLRRGLARTFPDQSTRGAVPYALMRSMQIRRFRLPPPRLKGSRRAR
jgi:Protein of unknown function (DUF3043)